MPTNLVRLVDDVAGSTPTNGQSVAFALDVVPQTNDKVEDVSADLYLVLNGVTNIVPFAFADESLTNAISLVEGEEQSVRMTISQERLAEALGGPFLTGDDVTYFAAVRYNSANGATDPAELYETRYFPDNSSTDSEGRWVVENDYVPVPRSFGVEGPALSCLGEPEVTTEGVKFNLHGFAATGISSLTVNLDGTDYHPFEGLDTNAQVRVTGEFALPTGLAPNTKYTVTITATDANGNALAPATFTIVTLPVATAATIHGVTPNAVQLSVSGSAAGYVVPSGWTQTSANTWTLGGQTPNSEVAATGIYPTNKLGRAGAEIDATPGYTLAAIATKAPTIERGVTTVAVGAGEDYAPADDGNPEGTEYAVRVTTSSGRDALVASETGDPIWKTLAAWQETPAEVAPPMIDLAATNYFSFVTRNFDGDETVNDAPVTTNCCFEMTTGFVDGKADQAASPFGSVDFSLNFTDPAQSADAQAEVEYRLGSGEWLPLCSFPVRFDEILSSTNLAWDAWTAVGQTQGTYEYSLRARVSSGSRASEWSEIYGSLDFAPPKLLAIDGSPANMAITSATGYDFTLSAHDLNNIAYSWTLDGVPGTGAAISGTGAATQNGVDHTLVVIATDAMGNACEPVTRTWKVDTVAPAGLAFTAGPAEGSCTDTTAFEFGADADDATDLTYHWTFNGSVANEETSIFAATAIEGTNTVSVYAEDAAGNVCDAITRKWVVDATAPSLPVVSGTPSDGALANAVSFNLSATSDDATKLTYHWAITGGSGSASGVGNNSFSGIGAEGENTVSVYATDAAGNKSPTAVWTWLLDTLAPTGLAITGSPADGSDTADPAVSLTATAEDIHDVTYHWTFNDAPSVGVTLAGVSQERINTATVYAEDAAGNKSKPVTITWRLDTINPDAPVLAGAPAAFTNVKAFSITAAAEDNEGGSGVAGYVWTLNGHVVDGTTGDTFAAELEDDGEYTVSVYAVDKAGNKGEPASVNWKLDTVKPGAPAVTGVPSAFTNKKAYSLAAAADDNQNGSGVDYYVWTLNGDEVAGATAAELSGEVEENREYTVSVYAVDKAGNTGDATDVKWTLDTASPDRPTVTGMPDELTNIPGYSLTAISTDSNGVDAFHWMIDKEEVKDASGNMLSGTFDSDKKYIVSVWATDKAGNVSETNSVSWVLDMTPPNAPSVAGLPGVQTNQKSFTLTASGSTDPNGVTYRWTFNEATTDGDTLTVSTEADDDYTVSVVAVDDAGNASEATVVGWTLDTVAPTVELASETSDRFNGSVAELLVTATFNEAVTNFTAESVAVSNGTVKAVSYVEIVDDQHIYTIAIVPDSNGEVVVNVEAGVVADAAGNRNEASNELTFIYDDVSPTVTLTSDTPARFNEASAPLVVNVAFSEVVTNFTAGSVTVVNGTDVSVSTVDGSETDYVVSVRPVAEGAVSVQIAAGAVADLAGNGNEASAVLERIYDTTGPTVTLSSETRDPFNLDDVFTVKVSFDEAVTNFTADCVTVSNGTVTNVSEVVVVDGTNTYTVMINPITGNDVTVSVEVQADAVTDLAGNGNAASSQLTRTCDTERPTVTFAAMRTVSLTAIPDTFNKGYLEEGGSFTVTLTFSEPVTSLLEDAIVVSNGTAVALAQVSGSDRAWTVQITPTIADDAEGVIAVQVKSDKFFDAAGNGNAPCEKTWKYDNQKPHDIRISGTPENGATVRGKECRVELTASATDVSGIDGWNWRIYRDNESTPIASGPYKKGPLNISKVFTESGKYKVSVRPRDASGLNNPMASDYTDPTNYTWTFIKEDTASADVEFGGGICVKVDPDTGATNSVSFTSIDFKPGETSTFVLNGFDVSSVQDGAPLGMWFVVSDTIGGPQRHVAVSATLDNTTKALTVTLPAAETENKNSLFIIGIDNKSE